MKPIQTCLTPELLRRLAHDDLTPEALRSVEEHLNGCPQCRALLDEAESDDFWRQAIAPALRSSPELGADDAIDSELEPSGDPSLNAVLKLLGPTDDPRMLGRIGSYEVVGVIGRGGMGVVFKAFDSALNRYVAIKMLSPSLAESGAARKRFEREGQAAAAVIDDHVLPIHGVNEWQGVPYLVMQYSRGSTLQRRVETQGPLELKEVLRIGMQTARGLAAAHASGLVHRDVKPSNILIDGTVERALLTDFGLARAVDDASITRSGMIAGTPQYMSPEQARGDVVDARSDLFSLGCVLYFMSTGRPPFRADNSYAVLRLIADQEPRNMREINPDLPAWLCTLVSHLMAKEPGDRPASAQEVAEVLQRCLAHVQQPAAVPLPDATDWSMKPSKCGGKRHRSPSNRYVFASGIALVYVFASIVVLIAIGLNAGLWIIPRYSALQSEESRANAAADAIAHEPEGDVYTFRRKGHFAANLITPETRKAMLAGLEFLGRVQKRDGSWNTEDYRGKVAVTAIAGRAFLAAGCQPDQGPDGARLTRAIEYILRHENDGLLAEGNSAPMYEHGFAVRFLAEVYGKVANGTLKDRMKTALTRAVTVVADAQNREGGWRYQPNAKDADLIVTCCQLQALAAARAAGFDVPRATIDAGTEYLLACRKPNGGFQYMPNITSNDTAAYTYTAAALSALKALRYHGDEQALEPVAAFLRGFRSPGVSDAFLYNVMLYEAHESAAPVVKSGGTDWNAWYSDVRDDLLDRRNKEGAWGDKDGSSPILTALALIILHAAE